MEKPMPVYPVECADIDAPDLNVLPPETAANFAAAVKRSLATGERVVAAVGRILPHSRRRATGGGK